MFETKVNILVCLLWVVAKPGLAEVSPQPVFDPRVDEFVWFDNTISDNMWDKEKPFQAVSKEPLMLSSALNTLLDSPIQKNNMKDEKPRFRLG